VTLGIFDSGEGGHNLLRYARMRNNVDDVIFLCDRANSPYGTKRAFELSGIVADNISRLKKMGAEAVIIACCTACTVFEGLPDTEGVSPILSLTARAAERISDGNIAVIATGATVRSGEFSRHIRTKSVTELEAQPLVEMIDRGASDDRPTGELTEYLESVIGRARGADTLILGCTHFSSVKSLARRIGRKYGIRHTVDAAEIGARLVPRRILPDGDGTDYIFNTKK